MSHDFRFPFFPILSYCFARPLALLGLLACLSRVGRDELRELCVALCSRLIARIGGWYIVSRAL